ncbi:VOC family protein [Alteromonas sp. 1_MG-2023]|uniref:VOC family protein n=1 Tax=Alteromonas sp. 1_MG-2023 TaxID=3062669 RepID=UPI0026E1C56D|nr:VOC family protein [Alteromonas sp. 1_MG-2023]MDO6568906.1 VOC family protein [Alteromonas sp. 1_MG-2023]
MAIHEKLNYVELGTLNISSTKQFFEAVFGWTFTDYGPEYTAFSDQGLDGGFFKAEQASTTDKGGALLVFYSADIRQTLDKVKAAGGEVVQSIFEFPGGCRFHFVEPGGNEFAVWSEKE